MWKRSFNYSILRDIRALSKRGYLTESYSLKQAWAERLNSPILQKVNMESFYFEIESKFQSSKKISPVDVDIYANKVVDGRSVDEIADLMQKLRTTEEAANVFDSTQHALIRNYIEANNLDSLVHVLNHRSEFGVFLDYFTTNMLLDKLIEEKNFKLGARFATIFALQEEFKNPITTFMSLFTCYNFLSSLETFEDLVVKPVEEEATDAPKSKKKKDETKVRVKYLINPYFDDHFDLTNTNHLLGKTLLYLADEIQPQNETLANSISLIGYALYEKFDDGNKFLAKVAGGSFYKEAADFVKSFAEKVEQLDENEPGKQYFDKVGSLTSLKDEKVSELIEKLMLQAVKEREAKDIEEQKKIYAAWIVERQEKLDQEIHRHNRIQRLFNIEKLQENLKGEEKKLWYFENQDKIDMEIESKRVFYPKRWLGKKKVPRAVDEHYIPPDVDSRRNVK